MKSEVIYLLEGRDDVTLTTYILEDSNEFYTGKNRPAVIVCPGGAYLSCGDREGEPVALEFARMGYQAFVLRYSVALTKYDTEGWNTDLNSRTPNPEKLHPQPMRDIAKAFEYINKHSKELRVDVNQIAICGFSAGGHNCAMYATHWAKPVIKDYIADENIVLKPAACILGYPLTDYVYMYETMKDDEQGFWFFNRSNRHFLGEDWTSEEKLIDASPARLVDENTPPTFIFTTAGDNMVPCQHSTLYATSLAEKKVPFEIHLFQDGDHGMSLCDESSAAVASMVNKDAAKWVLLCESWLRKHLILPL